MLINVSYTSHNDWEPKKLESALQKYGYVLDYLVKKEVETLEEDEANEFVEHYFSMIAAVADSCANEPTPFAILLEDLPLFVVCRLADVLKASDFSVITSKYATVKYEGNDLKEFAGFAELF